MTANIIPPSLNAAVEPLRPSSKQEIMTNISFQLAKTEPGSLGLTYARELVELGLESLIVKHLQAFNPKIHPLIADELLMQSQADAIIKAKPDFFGATIESAGRKIYDGVGVPGPVYVYALAVDEPRNGEPPVRYYGYLGKKFLATDTDESSFCERVPTKIAAQINAGLIEPLLDISTIVTRVSDAMDHCLNVITSRFPIGGNVGSHDDAQPDTGLLR